jgi:metal-dependent amidase/aminoacylase/carboxypeptidase family protein
VISPQATGHEGLTDSTIEGGGGKIRLLEAGAYSDHNVDISLMAHPGVTPDAALVRTAAYAGMKVEYFGKEAHAAARPWEGVRYSDCLIKPMGLTDSARSTPSTHSSRLTTQSRYYANKPSQATSSKAK